eukprot:m.81902 g.81902  ORF g.81902 m.81902 type:complete len:423 (+) comp19513_c0_seq1:325-1593(+)
MMMSSNSPTPVGFAPGHRQEDFAPFSKMVGLSNGVDRSLGESSFRNQSNFCTSDPTAGVTGGSDEYWRRLEDVLSDASSEDSWGGPQSPREHIEDAPMQHSAPLRQHYQPQVPQAPTLGSPVPMMGNVPIRQMQQMKSSPAVAAAGAAAPGAVNQYEKPPYSFPCLIGLSLQSCSSGRMSVAQIYEFVTGHFPYFRTAKAGWKNSVRHNLSLNKFFCKLERQENEQGKGSMWGIVPENKEQLIRDIQSCRNRYPSKFRGYAVQKANGGGAAYLTSGVKQQQTVMPAAVMPAAPGPKGVNRASSSPMLFGGKGGIQAMRPPQHAAYHAEAPRRESLPAQIQDYDFLDVSFDCMPMIKAEPEFENLLMESEVCWIGTEGGSSHSSSGSPTDGMEIADEWLPIPDDLSACFASEGGQPWGDSMFN